ncbi:hypothetical protein [Blastococcus brunescens]|uniref:Uncharacterized protein n=1 Tax=Blastococcus brunescens TaxID=1564165 RepID=A0ABZ1AUQ9_9ACTN|nr:hypothetical protein [Blastococcus sp. BMG 8361]WRL62304.1 hypothetical protein U6N30_20005 [Blastococcus sp. BMG 8361]
MDSSGNPVTAAIDGATGDWSMSGDAMRWSPELAEQQDSSGELRGIDIAAGLGAGLGLDMNGVRRLVSGALTSLGAVATDVVTEFRQLTRGAAEQDDEEDERA